MHHAEILLLPGDSYRLKDKSKDVLGTDPSWPPAVQIITGRSAVHGCHFGAVTGPGRREQWRAHRRFATCNWRVITSTAESECFFRGLLEPRRRIGKAADKHSNHLLGMPSRWMGCVGLTGEVEMSAGEPPNLVPPAARGTSPSPRCRGACCNGGAVQFGSRRTGSHGLLDQHGGLGATHRSRSRPEPMFNARELSPTAEDRKGMPAGLVVRGAPT